MAKLPEIRKEAFTKARESLGLSVKDLSGMACLSVRQIEQIENGESSSFYGAQIKFTAAKKVAGLLKLTPEDAFDFSGIAQSDKTNDVEVKLQEETKTSVIEKIAKPEKETKIQEKEASPLVGVKSKASADPKKKFLLLAAIGAAVIFSAVNLRPLFFPEPVKEEVLIIQEVTPEPAPAAEPAVEAKPAAVLAPEPNPAPVAAPTPVNSVLTAAECPSADPTALNYKPDTPRKAGDMVYLQSKIAQTVCVVDASGRTQNKTLEPGVGVSVFGRPPLKVLTGGLNQVDLYYQGAKVRIGNTTSKTIILEQAEIIQPAAPSTSTDPQSR